MAIYKVDDRYVISSKQMWLPGNYACERAAKLAFKLPDSVLVKFNGPIPATYEQVLEEFRKLKNEN